MKKQFGLKFSPSPPLRGRIHPDYQFEAFTRAISDSRGLLDSDATETLLAGRNRVGALPLPAPDAGGARDVVIKEYRTVGIDRLKSLFLPSKAAKAWRGSSYLALNGINTPLPIAYLEERKRGFLVRSFFFSDRIFGFEEIRCRLHSTPESDLTGLLRQLAHFISGCFDQGVLHRDLSDGNILVKEKDAGSFEFYMIDTNRIRIRRPIRRSIPNRLGPLKGSGAAVSSFSHMKNLIRLGIPPSYQRFFLSLFFETKSLKKRYWLWYKLNKAIYSGFIGFKKRLRLKKIAQKLKIQ